MARLARVTAAGIPQHVTPRVNARRFTLENDAYMDQGLSLDEAIAETLENFPSTPNGANGIRAVLGYRAACEAQPVL